VARAPVPSLTVLPTVCVIGAGASGLAAAKALHERGVPFDAFEQADGVGGVWAFRASGGRPAAYATLHLNSSRRRSEFSDFPIPPEYGDFPHHTQVRAYLEAYASHFGVLERITLRTQVQRAEPRPGGGWEVALSTGERRTYDALVVANGHHWDPRWPDPSVPGAERFAGRQLHAHDYAGEGPERFRGRRVVVVGMGNSAMDIAADAAGTAERVHLAARRGAHIVPKYLLGRPLDAYGLPAQVPFALRAALYRGLIRFAAGPPTRYGLPRPDHRVGQAHPTVSSAIFERLAAGTVVPKPNLVALGERTARFADGSEVEADVVVYATGYRVSFPFFAPELIAAPENDLPLFRRVFHPDVPDLAFIGLLQPLGAIMPLAEAQARWVADAWAGDYALPAPEAMRADMATERARMFRRYVASPRHTMQVDFDDYLLALRRERRRGARRARARARPGVAGA
jgi:cation diffusion facilitator CzcD-associated flavoprotein CzcO